MMLNSTRVNSQTYPFYLLRYIVYVGGETEIIRRKITPLMKSGKASD